MNTTSISSSIIQSQYNSFPQLLSAIAAATPEKTALRFLSFGGKDRELSYRDLMVQISSAAAHIQCHCDNGDRAVILLPAGVEFVSWFVGCFYAGVVATPTAVPVQRREWERLVNVLKDSQPKLLISDSDTLEKLQGAGILDSVKQAGVKIIDVNAASQEEQTLLVDVTPDMLAFLQYTSGSTGNPKGVMVSHGNLMHNEAALHEGLRSNADSVIVSWLPLFHDMGLIGQMLHSLYMGATLCLMSPENFLRDPIRWLEAIHQHGGTIAGGPNFAYELCIKKAATAPERVAALDLSRWHTAFNAAEPVRAETLARFVDVFGKQGFRREYLYPSYGLAESTLIITGAKRMEAPTLAQLDDVQLKDRRAVRSQKADAKTMVSSGVPLGEHRVLIVDPDTCVQCKPDQVGEIWIQGGSIAQGYWNNPEATAKDFQAFTTTGDGPFLRTGDLGFLLDGYIYISSRCKDLIIINGKNFYPQDIERSAEAGHAALRPGCSAAFSVERNGTEQLIVLCEIDPKKGSEEDFPAIMSAIRAKVFEQQSASVAQVALYAPNTLFKTSSGKIQRRSCNAAFTSGKLKSLCDWQSPQVAAVSEPASAAVSSDILLRNLVNHLGKQKELLAAFASHMSESMRQLDLLMSPHQAIEVPAVAASITANVEAIRDVIQRATPVAAANSPSRASIRLWLTRYLTSQLGLSTLVVNDHTAFSDYGLDSAQALEFCAAVSDWLGFDVPATQLWDCPNLGEFTQALYERSQQGTQQVPAGADSAWVSSLQDKELKSLIAADLMR
ncbi:MAG TPA: AMP-binding protein [Dongiaceae bacterium]|nr:AMP-binding protein [Dongiaceae bacterium]